MSGEALYKLYVKENLKLGVECDTWEDLGDDQAVWENLGEKLSLAEDCS